MGPGDLAKLVEPLVGMQTFDPRLLVGLDHPDDAAVYQVSDDVTLVFTMDFITPVVDDAWTWGAIAATNAMSDIWAMGGRPILALNMAAFPKDMPVQVGSQVIGGGVDASRRAGALVVGGHSVEDEEPKYGLAVVGLVNPHQLIRKNGAKVGDRLVLTKPVGGGLLVKLGKSATTGVDGMAMAIENMLRLNRVASELAIQTGVFGGTDVTGFGILGHGVEMAREAGVQFRLHYGMLPVLDGAVEEAKAGRNFPGKTWQNKEYFATSVDFDEALPQHLQNLLWSPETSGGLLLSVPPERTEKFVQALRVLGEEAWVVGEVESGAG
ncbi:selenide, water dikinase SelD, partial [Alicyclobacillaceae bacterium I2511]